MNPFRSASSCHCSRGYALLTGCLFLLASTVPAAAQEASSDPVLTKLMERLEKVEQELQKLKQSGKVPLAPEDQKLITVLSEPNLGVYYAGQPTEVRWLALRVTLINLTGEPVTVSKDDYELTADGLPMKLTELPSQIRNTSFSSGNQSYRLSALTTQELKLPPGANAQTWVVFPGLAKGATPRSLELKITREEKQLAHIDVVDYFGRQMGMSVERVGPRKSLGVVTIKGSLNTISLLKLVQELDNLVAEKVARAVIRWREGTPPPEAAILSWLRQVAAQSGLQEVTNHLYPAIPSSISEFHLVDPQPSTNNSTSYRTTYVNGVRRSIRYNPNARNVHKSIEVAIAAALKSAYEILPRDELVEEIQNGHRLTRAAALATGGGRLDSEHLPVIIRLAHDDDLEIQRGALVALRHFGEPQAIETLVHYARKNTKPLAETAVESLAGSRYAAAHEELLKLLKEDTLAARKEIVQILGKYARPIWADTLYGFVKDENSGVRVESLQALVTIGDERLFATLEEALKGTNRAMSEAALGHLIARDDRPSEKLALDWTLAHIQKSPPTAVMYQLLTKTKDQRAVAPLLAHLKNRKGDQSQLINTLAQIGDESVGETLGELFDSLGNSEKRSVINALYQLRTPAFQKIAESALKTTDYSLISTTCQLLQQDASPQSVEILATALKNASNTNQFSYICNALGAIATDEARTALRDASKAGDDNKKNMARQALQNLYARSPGMIYVRQGESQFKVQKDSKKALNFYELAVQIDPELPHARRARANQLLREETLNDEQLKKVQGDYQKLVELDPDNSETWTGLGLVTIRLGEIDAGIKHGEDIRGKYTGNNIFHYNMACIYGRSIEALSKKESPTEEETKKIAAWKKQAVADLKEAFAKGFSDLKWAQEDPDLKSIHELPEFKSVIEERTKAQPVPGAPRPVQAKAAAQRAVIQAPGQVIQIKVK